MQCHSVNLKELSFILNIPTNTLRTYLGNWMFTRFYNKGYFEINEYSANLLYTYLYNKRKIKNATRLKNIYPEVEYVQILED